jgi:chromosome partitioning protein
MGHLAYDAVIPRSVKLGEAPSHGKTILEYAPDSKGAEAYQALCQEFLQRHGALVAA